MIGNRSIAGAKRRGIFDFHILVGLWNLPSILRTAPFNVFRLCVVCRLSFLLIRPWWYRDCYSSVPLTPWKLLFGLMVCALVVFRRFSRSIHACQINPLSGGLVDVFRWALHSVACDQIPAMQKRVITPYPDAPDLGPYEEEDSESVVFSPKTQSELEPSCRLSPLETPISCTAKIFIWLPSLITDQVFLVKKRCNGGSPEENASPAEKHCSRRPRWRLRRNHGDALKVPEVTPSLIGSSVLPWQVWLTHFI